MGDDLSASVYRVLPFSRLRVSTFYSSALDLRRSLQTRELVNDRHTLYGFRLALNAAFRLKPLRDDTERTSGDSAIDRGSL